MFLFSPLSDNQISALNPAIYAYLNKEFKMAFKRVLCCLPRSAMVDREDRDAMLDEISTTSRSYQRGSGCGGGNLNLHGGFGGSSFAARGDVGGGRGSGGGGIGGCSLDVPPTPGFMSRTPSATPETHWPIVQAGGGGSLLLDRCSIGLTNSRNASLCTTATEESTMTTSIVIPVTTKNNRGQKKAADGKSKKNKNGGKVSSNSKR